MTATVIDGKAFAAKVRGLVAEHVPRLHEEQGLQPGLAVVLVGEDPASQGLCARTSTPRPSRSEWHLSNIGWMRIRARRSCWR